MAKYDLRLKARELRVKGFSIKKITEEQLKNLVEAELLGKALGRFKAISIHKKKRSKLLNSYDNIGINTIGLLNDREFLVTGLALYWAEGGESFRNRRVEFCNSDPRMIQFIMPWFQNCLEVKQDGFVCVVGINELHSTREQLVKEYWSNITGVPLGQFRKTSFKRVKNKKVYDNVNDHYGTLSVLVVKSTNLYYKIMGLIKGLSNTKCF